MNVDINPASAVADNARYFGDQTALTYEGLDVTFRALEERAARLARVLADRGVARGDRVAYLGMNSLSFVTTMLASLRMGAIYVPVNFRLAQPELLSVLQRSGATSIVAEEAYRTLVDAVAGRTSLGTRLLVDDDPHVLPDGDHPGWEGWHRRIAAVSGLGQPVPGHFDDPAMLLYTSGTTGSPRGVIMTYGNLWWNSVNTDTRLDTRRGDTTYACTPLFHIGALNSFALRSLVRGGRLVVRRSFDPEVFLDDIEHHRVHTTFVVPSMVDALARVPEVWTRDLSSLRAVVVAGAPVPPAQIERFAAHGVILQQAWGMTESAPTATHLPAEQTLHKLGSAGIPMPYTQVRVVDADDGEPVASGVLGELVVRGPNLTPGYWDDPEATAAAFDAEGWFHSGDIGYADEDGYFYIVDRLKDMIISGGENIYPAEVERVLAAMPGIKDVAVLGAPDSRWGETVVAVCSLSEGTRVTLDDIRNYAAAQIARYKLPRRLQVVPVIPRNTTGKLDKRAIQHLLANPTE